MLIGVVPDAAPDAAAVASPDAAPVPAPSIAAPISVKATVCESVRVYGSFWMSAAYFDPGLTGTTARPVRAVLSSRRSAMTSCSASASLNFTRVRAASGPSSGGRWMSWRAVPAPMSSAPSMTGHAGAPGTVAEGSISGGLAIASRTWPITPSSSALLVP